VYTISPKHSGKYVAPQNASTANDAKIVQMSATEGGEQQWEAIPFTAGAYQLKNVKSGKCLDVPTGSTATGTQLVQYSCHPDGNTDQVNQRFYLIPSGDAYQISSAVSGLCLDINGRSQADGAALIQWTCSNDDNQRFGFTPVSSPSVPLSVTATSRCVGTSAYVAVTAVNDGDAPASVTLSTPYGSTTVADVAPGKQAYQSFNARAGQIGAGKATVKGTATIDGKQVTSTYDAAYNAISCA
jgi:hypothetical protein